jgi:very-short-patch-repair endonuclease
VFTANRIDLVGQKFGRLEVVEMLYSYKGGKSTYCRCKCECGNEKIINAGNVSRGLTKSCGCLERESRYNRKHGKFKPGEIVNGFTLIEETSKRASNCAIIWRMQCKCGNIIEASPSQIVHAGKFSCGCDYVHPLLKDITGQRFGMLTVIRESEMRVGAGKRVAWVCKCDCGRETIVASDCLCSGGTTSCGCKTKSIWIENIKKMLDNRDIDYIPEHRFDDCRDQRTLPFDIYIPSLNTVIEYDGRQHFEPVKLWGDLQGFETRVAHDRLKDEYCASNGIRIVRIPYYMKSEEIKGIIDELEPVTSKCYAEQSA